MKHLGDIAKVHGGDIAPVDVITFGSPCQDLSVAGGQKGMKYVCPACGVEFAITAGAASCPMCGTEIEKTRSGLFIEAVRIIKEMRKKTNGKQPRFAVWENVPGAFSSNKGADFQIVLLELCRVTEPKAPAIAVPKGGWPTAGCLTDVGGGSIAWRTLDAQFHGVPQRRRRIILVCDFAGQCAGQLLFKPSGLPGYPAEGVCKGQAPAGAAAVRADYAGEPIGFAYKASGTAGSVAAAVNTAPTLLSARHDAAIRAQVFCKGTRGRFKGDAPTYKPADVANTLNTFDTGETRANELVVCEQPAKPFCLQGSMIGRADRNGPQGNGVIVGAEIAHNADRPHIGQGSEILAQALVHAGLGDLFPVDGIGILHDAHFLSGYFADDADSQTGSGEWLTEYQVFRNTQLQAHLADLILKEEAQRLYDLLEIDIIRQSAYIVVGLDDCGFSQSGFDDVGINGSLYQEVYGANFLCLFFKDTDEFLANDFTLSFRLFHAF